MNDKIKAAFDEVRKFHPAVTTLVLNKYGQWNFCDDNFNSPAFTDEIDMGVIEDAADSVESIPCVFCL